MATNANFYVACIRVAACVGELEACVINSSMDSIINSCRDLFSTWYLQLLTFDSIPQYLVCCLVWFRLIIESNIIITGVN